MNKKNNQHPKKNFASLKNYCSSPLQKYILAPWKQKQMRAQEFCTVLYFIHSVLSHWEFVGDGESKVGSEGSALAQLGLGS